MKALHNQGKNIEIPTQKFTLNQESLGGQSKADFIHKLSIAQKEIRETKYWIKLLIETSSESVLVRKELFTDVEEISKIITKIIITSKNDLKK